MDGRDKCLSSIPNSVNAVENDDLHLQLYPNPNQGVFTVQLRAHIEQLFVFDIAGKLIKQMEGNERYILSDLKAGVYTIKVIAGGKATKKNDCS